MGNEPGVFDGVLVVDKPQGPTSHDIVTLARRALGISRIGHTGTLDPMATGVLPLVVGRATRLAQFLTAHDKSYDATIAFGRSTNTYDAMGTVIDASNRRPSLDQLTTALSTFRGTFEQTPPAFSAKSIDGSRAYDLARRATDGPLRLPKSVIVTAQELELIDFDGDTVRLSMRVTAGFYVRSLAHDLGTALATGAVLVALRRTRSGEFGVASAMPLNQMIGAARDELSRWIVPLGSLLLSLPALTLRAPVNVERVKNGVAVGPADVVTPLDPPPDLVRLIGPDGALVGLAKPDKIPGFLHPAVVLV